ncbi:MAG: arginine repressor [Bdellovibrionales bacterium]|nr:arginine repressor [Bdellovibrionales bacterium]
MDRLQVLKEILFEGSASTQDEIREALEKRKFQVTQSTVSRDLKRIGAIKTIDSEGRTVYRLGEDLMNAPVPATVANSMKELVTEVSANGAMIVVHTSPGSASLVARHIDSAMAGEVLGTIAGEDTIFVAPADVKKIAATLAFLQRALLGTDS